MIRNKVALPSVVLGIALLADCGSSGEATPNASTNSVATLYKVHVPSITQKDKSWCIPAASEMSLSSITHRSIGQSILAEAMHTDDPVSGTRINAATDVLNQYANPLGYKYVELKPSSSEALEDDLQYDLSRGWAPLLGVIYDERPWDKHTPLADDGHEIVVEGLTTTGQAIVEDPETLGNGGGQHVVGMSELYGAMIVQGTGNLYGQMPLGVELILANTP